MEINLESIQTLMKLMSDHKIDKFKLGDLELTKTRHEAPKVAEPNSFNKVASPMTDADELLFWSTSTPSLTQEQIAQLAVNPMPPSPPPPKTKKGKDK